MTSDSPSPTIKTEKPRKSIFKLKKYEFNEDGTPKIGKNRLLASIAAVTLALFLSSLDGTIVASALPTITNKFDSAGSTHWFVAVNLLANTYFQTLAGRLSDIFGRREILFFSIFVFEVGSLVGGIASTFEGLLAARAISGVGAAGIIVLVSVIVSEMVPIRERGKYNGIVGISFGLACVIGPLLGGVLTDKLSYKWCFLINLPLGIVAAVFIYFLVITKDPVGTMKERMDRLNYIGALLLIGGLVMVLLGLNFGGNEHKWVSATVLCLIIIGLAVLVAYVIYDDKYAKEAILPLRLFPIRNVWTSIIESFGVGFSMYGLIYAVPNFYTIIKNANAQESGIFLLPFMIGMIICSIGGGLYVTKTGRYRPMFRIGTLVLSIGAGLMLMVKYDTRTIWVRVFLAIIGIGVGLSMQALIICVQATVSKPEIASATSFASFARDLGGTLGTTISGVIQKAIITSEFVKLDNKYPSYLDQIQNTKKSTSQIYSQNLPQDLKTDLIKSNVRAMHYAFLSFFIVACITFLLTLLAKNAILGETDSTEGEIEPSSSPSSPSLYILLNKQCIRHLTISTTDPSAAKPDGFAIVSISKRDRSGSGDEAAPVYPVKHPTMSYAAVDESIYHWHTGGEKQKLKKLCMGGSECKIGCSWDQFGDNASDAVESICRQLFDLRMTMQHDRPSKSTYYIVKDEQAAEFFFIF
ncbi:hypothetical protein BB560_002305 [Smittium megazygosporum]|uniref:MFS-type drug efflux transporter P55 n=1 Tax=Smittium megazygosporum TaxID=133381 RepID=A0A2T9ZF60_9FUNG|nr:hypothetical protein BB560_002305 [Smittium megazygosporum]